MAHNPVNHPARPVYRAIGGLVGLYLLGFGVLGVLTNSGEGFFTQGDTCVLGQGANLAYSVLALIFGGLILSGIALGRNLDVAITKAAAYVFLVLGLGMLAVSRTEANVFNFSVATVIVSMLLGLVLLMVGMYSKVGSDEDQRAWQEGRLML